MKAKMSLFPPPYFTLTIMQQVPSVSSVAREFFFLSADWSDTSYPGAKPIVPPQSAMILPIGER